MKQQIITENGIRLNQLEISELAAQDYYTNEAISEFVYQKV